MSQFSRFQVIFAAVFLIFGQQCSGVNWNGNNWAMQCDFPGKDMSNVQIASNLCGGKCAATSGCTHFTWTNYNGGTCWMKSGSVSPSDAVNTNDPNMVCGYMANSGSGTVNWNGNNWATGCDFSNHDLSNIKTTSAQCGGTCAATNGCTHFTWTNWNGGTCWMKSGSVSPSDAVATGDSTMVCGYMGSGGGQQQSGTTTRYWDCCKPSCSWSGKANVNHPVNSCAKDGFSVLGVDAGSGCGGGPAYTCSSQIPWQVTNDLSYGFAAANIVGSSEAGWCCACYQLTFTSGPVSGKKMVVQVTNTGSDLGANHFDLQIPGGGVGIFNGCSSQWGAPSTGWGAQYGGVSSLAECAQLPSQIRAGCEWRFGWFQGANNPSMTFIPVTCPVELTQKSGCIRN